MHVGTRQLDLPKAYGSPTTLLAWEEVEQKLIAAMHYWLVTTRPDGRPHAVPVDGTWLDGAAYFGGDPATVHVRNLQADPRAILHLESGEAPVIVEGEAEWHTPGVAQSARLTEASRRKYGYGPPSDSHRSGLWRLQPRVVLAWMLLYRDATRFEFT